MKKRLRLSQAMIVKNEEKNLRKALGWGRDIVCEQIVIDTGSTDNTVLLAKELGARVLHFEWRDDFAAAKNFAIEQCSGDWIALLDADEYFSEEDAGKLLSWLEKADAAPVDGVLTAWLHLDGEGRIGDGGSIIRLFRNRPEIRYRRRIHEQLSISDGRNFVSADLSSELAVFHTGYAALRSSEKVKSERNLRLIRQELSEHPEDFEMLSYLGNEYFLRENWKEAEKCYREALRYLPEDYAVYSSLLGMNLSYQLHILEKTDAGEEYYEELCALTERLLPGEADPFYLAGRHFYGKEQFERAAEYLSEALRKLESYGSGNRSPELTGGLRAAYIMTAEACRRSGRLQDAVRYAGNLLREDAGNKEALSTLLKSFHAGGLSPEPVVEFLRKLYSLEGADRAFLQEAAKEAEFEALFLLLSDSDGQSRPENAGVKIR